MLMACGGIHINIILIILGVKYTLVHNLSDTAIEIKYHYRKILW